MPHGIGSVTTVWHHWSLDPFILVVAVLVAVHQVGLRRLTSRSRPERAAAQRNQAALYYAGLGLLLISVISPIDYWSDVYFSIHMIQHLLIMFAAPILVVAGAPWLPYARVLPRRARLGAGRGLQRTRGWWRGGLAQKVWNPWVVIVLFNFIMVLWHVPGPFDLADRNLAVHIWLMHGSLFVAGVLFWREIIGSYPMRPRLNAWQRIGAIVGTNIVMWFLAIALGMLASKPWYAPYAQLSGTALSPLADQRIGAGLLWICGDFWAWPALSHIVRHDLLRERRARAAEEAAMQESIVAEGGIAAEPVVETVAPA